jgi:uncharacterized membrane protein
MLTIAIILIVAGILATAFGVAQNTILFNIFADLNSQLERAHHESDFEISWIFNGPGTIVYVCGILAIVGGIVLVALKRAKDKEMREINKRVKQTNQKRQSQSKKGKR